MGEQTLAEAYRRARQKEYDAQLRGNVYFADFHKWRQEARRLTGQIERQSEVHYFERLDEKQLRALHLSALHATAESGSAEARLVAGQMTSILEESLATSHRVDFDLLKAKPRLPEFSPGGLAGPTPRPEKISYPQRPSRDTVKPLGIFGSKKRHAERVAEADAKYAKAIAAWEDLCRQVDRERKIADEKWRRDDAERLAQLDLAREEHSRRCSEMTRVMEVENQKVDALRNAYAFDVPEAIERYLEIVLTGSIYPSWLDLMYQFEFDISSREVKIELGVPEPYSFPWVKGYRVNKSRLEVTDSYLPLGERRSCYSSFVGQVALRVMHEIFSSDPAGKVRTVALTLYAERDSPATGHLERVSLVVVGTDRDEFSSLDLARVEPMAALKHLGAAISKAPYDMRPAEGTGIRTREIG